MKNLYIVATPIGNLQDVSLRAARILLESRIIIAESTSKAGILLEFLRKTFPTISGSTPKIISLTEGEEEQKIPSILRIIETNDAALISEAGTPLISDPGFKLVREAIKRGIRIVPIPGPSAVISALSASGLPTDKFVFLGFLPKSRQRKHNILKKLNSSFDATIVAFDSPSRIKQTLKVINEVNPYLRVVIGRELTKVHEEFIRGVPGEVLRSLHSPKGEITLMISHKG